MRFSMGIYFLVGVFVLFQPSFGDQNLKEGNHGENGKASEFYKRTEQLIEEILHLIKNYHVKVRNIYKCVPDKIVEPTKEILQHSTDCLYEIEKKLDGRHVTKNAYEKLFRKCLEQEKKEVANLTGVINSTVDLCPRNVTEKSYQIKTNTSSKKAFDMNIKVGPKITQKTIVFESRESNIKIEDGVSLKREDDCVTEKPEASTREDEYEMYNADENIDDELYNNLGDKEVFATTEKSQMGAETQSKIQRSNSEEDDENEDVDEVEESVGMKGEIWL